MTTTNDGSRRVVGRDLCGGAGDYILKTPDAAQVNAGEQIGFTMTVWNRVGDAQGVTLTDTLPRTRVWTGRSMRRVRAGTAPVRSLRAC